MTVSSTAGRVAASPSRASAGASRRAAEATPKPLSCAESRIVAAKVAGGLATAFERLSPERKAAMRAMFAQGRGTRRLA